MKALTIACKTLIENWREPQLFLLLLLFPSVLVALYFFAYGSGAQGMSNFLKISVLNQDQGELGAQLIERLRRAEFDGKPIFDLQAVASEQEALNALMENKTALLIVIPADFAAMMREPHSLDIPRPVTVHLRGDPASDLYVFSKSMLSDTVQSFADEQTGWHQSVDIRYQFIEGTGTINDFQFGVPGVIVFGILFGIISAATILVREDVSGTLQRLRLSQANSLDILIGIALAIMLESAIQVPITFGLALLFGFESPGSLLLAIALCMVLSLAGSGFGFITACFARSDGEAANLATIFLLPLVFFAGVMFPMPDVTIAVFGARAVSLYDLLPSTHAVEALRRILIYGDGPGAIVYEIADTVLLSLLYLGIGIWLYQRLRLKRGQLTTSHGSAQRMEKSLPG